MACNYCRKRKRKCDGKQPICSLCEEANHSECEYRDLDASGRSTTAQVGDILGRVKALEESFASLRDRFGDSNHAPLCAVTPAGASMGTPRGNDAALSTTAAFLPAGDQRAEDDGAAEFTPMLIPPSHSTTTSNLLRCGPVRDLLGDYPPDLFLHVESRRPLPPALRLGGGTTRLATFPSVSRAEADNLVREYFDLVNQLHPMLDERDFWISVYEPVMEMGFQGNASSALVLATLALGSAASELPVQSNNSFRVGGDDDCWMPGVQYFSAALPVLVDEALASLGASLELTQALFLAALYYSYLARPLQAWRLVHMASTDVQHYWNRYSPHHSKTGSASRHQSILRLSWAIFVLECDIIAEHHLPRSGIEHVVEKLSFPSDGYNDSLQPAMLRWLADLSARRLLNRIHYVLYDDAKNVANRDATTESPGARRLQPSLHALSQELEHQLHSWFDLLPASIKPDIAPNQLPNPCIAEAITLLRYYATGDIIYRPFLLHVCSMSEGEIAPEYVVENAKKCLYYCKGYIAAVEHAVQASTASLEIFLHS
ncbi:hypothetical protein SBRCBS47491_002829 [Sporothrix bragantina]|uniref:Zn(2)-C6 fungal-type domain-containing protein n=1 Tax=Sporothrix bragantina TaxID=671064 RepID=A0ABP0BA38_9PEZI